MASAEEPQDAELPRALLKRLVKAALVDADTARGGGAAAAAPRDFQVSRDALLAFGEAGKLFVHFLTAAANDICKDAKRQTISAEDVAAALSDLEFGELAGPLRAALEEFRVANKDKSRRRSDAAKDKKAARAAAADAGAPPPESAGGPAPMDADAGGSAGDE
jgi:DNA polymerase epsilon subunit 3